MRTLWALAFGVVFGLLAAGVLLLVARRPNGEAIHLLPPPTPLPLTVHVTGAVSHPGLCKLPPGSRVQDAIQAAGGLLSTASDQDLNLAALVQDGDQIRVPLIQVDMEAPASAGIRAETFEESPVAPQPGSGRIDINTASIEELDQLPGIGPVTAHKIVAYREENGPFATIEAIQDVPGIGPAKFEQMRELITVEGVR
jgi:competence protein ComEA